MKRLSLFVVALAFVAVGCSKSSTSPSTPTNPTFTATLSAANEVPPITGAEAGGRGDATITFVVTKDAAGNITAATVTFVANLNSFPPGTQITLAHIHEGAAGVGGPVRIGTTLTAAQPLVLTNGTGTINSPASGTVDVAVVQAIINNPAGFYFNAHSTLNGGGVVRGQLVKVS